MMKLATIPTYAGSLPNTFCLPSRIMQAITPDEISLFRPSY
jgi:hypothetical protein